MSVIELVKDQYFDWLVDLVCGNKFAKSISYRKLLKHLHSIEFTFTIAKDANRAFDGEDLRYRYAMQQGAPSLTVYWDDAPCSVLEMMVALSLRCEESFMDNPSYGDRTGQWFWGMISTLGLNGMTDRSYDPEYVERTIDRFLNRDYEPDGRGGLFRIRNCDKDLRKVEIWYQLCWYLDLLE